jgi:hypothetical protein
VCRAYGARTMLGDQCPSPAGLGSRLAVGPTGLEAQIASLKNIPRTSLQNCRSLGFARDDKGEGDASMCIRWLVTRTADPSTSLRSGRDDNSYFGVNLERPRKVRRFVKTTELNREIR